MSGHKVYLLCIFLCLYHNVHLVAVAEDVMKTEHGGPRNVQTQALHKALPRPPTNVRTSEVTPTSVKLAWSYDIGSENIIYFVLQYKQKNSKQELTEVSGVTSYFYMVGGLAPYTEYEFYVIAVNGIGRGAPSSPIYVTTGENSEYILSPHSIPL